MASNLTVSLRTSLGFKECLEHLKQALCRAGFQLIAQVPFHLAFQKYLGLQTSRYVALIVWNPFQAYRAVLGDREAGLFNPFSVVVADEGRFTVISSGNYAALELHSTSLAVGILLRDLEQKVRQVFAELEALDQLQIVHNPQEVRKEVSP